jgi:predicted DNA-binding transcriptional regulator AlpA
VIGFGASKKNKRVKKVKGSKAVPQEEKPVRGELLTMAQAAEKTNMSQKWLYAHMVNGTLPFPWFMPSPGKRFIDSADIEDWQRSIKVPAGKMPGDIKEAAMV